MEPVKLNFRDCTLLDLEKKLKLEQVDTLPTLDNWQNSISNYKILEFEMQLVKLLQENLKYRVNDWNEIELNENFIGPLLGFINFNTRLYGLFSDRLLKAIICDYELSGYPDAVIAKGRREPEIPYFCFSEYKKETDNKGDPAGQCLAPMLVAQELNNNRKPIFGLVVKGEKWQFIVLQGKEYAISKSYISTNDDIYDIVKLLKHLKTIIEEFVKQD